MTVSSEKIKKFLIRTLRDIVIVLLIGLTISLIFSRGGIFQSYEIFMGVVLYCLIIGGALWKLNEMASSLLDIFFPWDKRPGLALAIDVIGTVIVSAIVIFTVNYFFHHLIAGFTFKDNPRYFILVGVIQLFISLLITGVFYVTKYFKGWRTLLIREEQNKREALSAQYEALKSHINPHFLFNSLSVLDSLIDVDAAKAKSFVSRFSDVYRYILEQKDKTFVSIHEELEFVHAYINLHQLRLGDALAVNIEIDDTSGQIVPVSLQILLENAFKHNEASRENPLRITITRQNNQIMVSNNFQPRKIITDNHGFGLASIDKQYEQLTGKNIRVTQSEGLFTVALPIIYQPENQN
ncbi:sensor histidine kinase [Alkaliflexus imshenetskii]|uniref:sensor histidine kinase n=1 Tax=Alkaliflexus imshenetskii TaxID=286730 RepID=UPI00047C1ED5|nr:sensor histidine kinase [Alkaliflexus imshenetskii]